MALYITLSLKKYWFQMFWICLNLYIFFKNFKTLNKGPEHYYLRQILGVGLCISRATAPVLNLSCCLVILPMCRSLNSLIHRTLNYISSQMLSCYLSKAQLLHMTFATTIFIATIVHTIGHIFNAVNFSKYYNEMYPDINWASYKNEHPLLLIFTTLPGLTGVSMCIILVLLLFTSLRWFRRHHYNVFWFTHNFSILFLALMYLHPLSGVLKQQTNLSEHVPGCITHGEFYLTQTALCKNKPKFSRFKSNGWVWISVPITIYLIELVFRMYSRCKDLKVLELLKLPGRVVCLSVSLPDRYISFKPGQYILLKCDQLSKLEWHPFTITSCNHSNEGTVLSVLIKCQGDWTSELYDLVKQPIIRTKLSYLARSNHNRNFFKFHVEGPFSSPMEQVTQSKYAICIAGGIGITAFAASLKHMLNGNIGPKSFQLIWIVRNMKEFMWFAQLICDLYHKFWLLDSLDQFHVELYLTQKSEIILIDSYKILHKRIQIGRPDWDQLFHFWSKFYEKKSVNVFCCGPVPLIEVIRSKCKKISKCDRHKLNFIHDSYS